MLTVIAPSLSTSGSPAITDNEPFAGTAIAAASLTARRITRIAAVPNGLTVEYMPWSLRLFEETPALDKGMLVVPSKPGLGLAFDKKAIEKYEVR